MDWNNIDFNSPCERGSYLIFPLSFSDLLMEINCNLPVIDEMNIAAQFEEDLQSRVKEAREIFAANLKKLTKYAQQQREED